MKHYILALLLIMPVMAMAADDAEQETAKTFHMQSFVMDLHTDTLIAIENLGYDFGKRHYAPFGFMPLMTHVDMPRARDGGLDSMFLGLVANPLWGDGPEQINKTLEVAYTEILNKYPEQIELAWYADDLTRIVAEGKTAVQFLVEGAHCLGTEPAYVDELYSKGVRVIGLAHFTSNIYAASSADETNQKPWLTSKGKKLIAQMNEIGMAIDLAHVHPVSFKDVIKLTKAPVIVSHTGVSALKPSFRNLMDWQIKAVAQTGGVIGVMFAPVWLGSQMYPPLKRVVEHMLHIKKLVGSEHIALGSDFDGFIWLPRGMRDVTDLPALTAEMLENGFSKKEVKGILGGNILRVLRAVEKVATRKIEKPAAAEVSK